MKKESFTYGIALFLALFSFNIFAQASSLSQAKIVEIQDRVNSMPAFQLDDRKAQLLLEAEELEKEQSITQSPARLKSISNILDEIFADLDTVIVDEWHELLSTKRGVQTELALSRLRAIRPQVITWGLSATLSNLDEAVTALVGPQRSRHAHLIKANAPRNLEFSTLIPEPIERFPWAGHLGLRLLPQVIEALEHATTTLAFTNTRSQAERWYDAIRNARPDWKDKLALHHGSVDRELRNGAEAGLRDGTLKCVVATSSLDLGVDFGPVEQVLQIGSPKGIARILQRAGRSGHAPGAVGRLICVPTHALELIECAAARIAATAGSIEPRRPLTNTLDCLSQHIVTVACSGGFREHDLYKDCLLYTSPSPRD